MADKRYATRQRLKAPQRGRPPSRPVFRAADQLSLHVNHLNKAMQEVTGKPTGAHIAGAALPTRLRPVGFSSRSLSRLFQEYLRRRQAAGRYFAPAFEGCVVRVDT